MGRLATVLREDFHSHVQASADKDKRFILIGPLGFSRLSAEYRRQETLHVCTLINNSIRLNNQCRVRFQNL